MTSGQRFFLFITIAYLMGVCGCTHKHTRPTDDLYTQDQSQKPTQFASMIRAPGERVNLNEPGTPVVTIQSTEPPRPYFPVPAQPTESPTPPAPLNAGPMGSDFWPPKPVPMATEPYLVAALAAWEGRPSRTADALRTLDPATQDAVKPLLLSAARIAQIGLPDCEPKDVSALLEQIRKVEMSLERRAELRIENSRFVREVEGFRRFDPMPDAIVFRQGQQLRLYGEITPLVADALPGGGSGIRVGYALRVKDQQGKTVTLVDSKGQSVPVLGFVETTDRQRGPVIEKHFVVEFAGPHAPGVYQAELDVRDLHTNRLARKVLEFRVGSK